MEFLSLKDHVYQYVSESIRTKALKPNDKINEQDISNKLNISRTPVREALIQLSADGLLESSPRRGFRVKPISEKEAEDLYSLIAALDSMAASLAIDYLEDEDFELMEKYIVQMNQAIENYEFSEYYRLQSAFHDTYILKSDNNPLIETITKLLKRFIRQGYEEETSNELQKVLYETNNEHQHILELFKSGERQEIETFIKDKHWSINFAELDALK